MADPVVTSRPHSRASSTRRSSAEPKSRLSTSDRFCPARSSKIISELNAGRLRVAEKIDGAGSRTSGSRRPCCSTSGRTTTRLMPASGRAWFDKVPLRFDGYTESQFRDGGFRVVPPATVRVGAFIGRNVILMPSYVNIGAYVDEGTMVDTWATVGSCAQIGKNVHLSGGVGIGGVLEPLQANPTIIEDNCFIGARSEVVEGVIVEANSVLSMGVYIGQSTKIYDRATGEVHYGPCTVWLGRRARQSALGRRQLLAVVRRHRQARRRDHARQDVHQRAAARLMDGDRGSGIGDRDWGSGIRNGSRGHARAREAAHRLSIPHAR